jgi:nucleoid-associated protein YgaU
VEKVIPPRFRDYTVQKGDTSFEKIAARREVFGNSKLGEVVSRANPFVSPDRLKVGQTVLNIPLDPENIQGKTVWVEVGPDGQVVEKPAGDGAARTPPETPAKAERTYTLRAEDTLSSVAEQFYGKSSMWKVIAEANKDVLPNPNKLKPGTVIRIPAQ